MRGGALHSSQSRMRRAAFTTITAASRRRDSPSSSAPATKPRRSTLGTTAASPSSSPPHARHRLGNFAFVIAKNNNDDAATSSKMKRSRDDVLPHHESPPAPPFTPSPFKKVSPMDENVVVESAVPSSSPLTGKQQHVEPATAGILTDSSFREVHVPSALASICAADARLADVIGQAGILSRIASCQEARAARAEPHRAFRSLARAIVFQQLNGGGGRPSIHRTASHKAHTFGMYKPLKHLTRRLFQASAHPPTSITV